MPRGGSSVIFTLLCRTPMGKYGTVAALKNNLKLDLESLEVLPSCLAIRSRAGNHERARWQFCSITQLPLTRAA